jgi:hypothetical protein
MWFATNGGVYIYDGTTLKHCWKRRASI